jgi:hypothetical protein
VFLDGWSPDYPVGDDIGAGVNTALPTDGTRTRGEEVSTKI